MFRGIARLSAVLLATGLAAAGTVATAAAAPSGGGADVATLGDFIHYGRVAISGPQGDEQADGGTVGLNMGGQSLAVYCIDLYHDTQAGVQYTETDWNKSTLSGNPNAGKIQWILNNSYPDLSVSQVESETGVQGLTQDSAAAATQAAIWHYSDNVVATPTPPPPPSRPRRCRSLRRAWRARAARRSARSPSPPAPTASTCSSPRRPG
jgi:TQXA domain-containing protein